MTGYCPNCGNTICVCGVSEHCPVVDQSADYERLKAENEQLRRQLKHCIAAMDYAFEDSNDHYYFNIKEAIQIVLGDVK